MDKEVIISYDPDVVIPKLKNFSKNKNFKEKLKIFI